jgi:hypothetical protein
LLPCGFAATAADEVVSAAHMSVAMVIEALKLMTTSPGHSEANVMVSGLRLLPLQLLTK